MEIGSFNLYKVKLNLDMCKTKEEKLNFLYGMKRDIRKVISCFGTNKFLPLRHYLRDDIILEDNCPELKHFLKRAIMRYSFDTRDQRFPGDEVLKREMMNEAKKYERFDQMLDIEIEFAKTEHRESLESRGINIY
ncbi:MAG: hypothetical protein JW995_10330 [Melioribacteraceae bacterium]|nr:hypothetical protein [Melioribacteraceae bacterium]